jgi:hypothetical protein
VLAAAIFVSPLIQNYQKEEYRRKKARALASVWVSHDNPGAAALFEKGNLESQVRFCIRNKPVEDAWCRGPKTEFVKNYGIGA